MSQFNVGGMESGITTTLPPWDWRVTDAQVAPELEEERKQERERLETTMRISSLASQAPETPEATEEGFSVLGVNVPDVFKGIGNGVAGFAQSMVGLADGAVELFGGDLVDDASYKTNVFGEQESFLGGIAQGVTQFTLGLLTGNFVIGAAAKGAQAFNFANAAKALTTPGLVKNIARFAVADFTAFHESQFRLSNLIEGTDLANPVTEYLMAQEDDDFLLGRIKNVAEGMLAATAFTGIGKVLGAGIKGLKVALGVKQSGATAAGASAVAQAAIEKELARDLPTVTVPDIFASAKKRVDELLESGNPQDLAKGLNEALTPLQGIRQWTAEETQEIFKYMDELSDHVTARIAGGPTAASAGPWGARISHGSPIQGLTEIRPSHSGDWGRGIYFGTEESAKGYAAGRGGFAKAEITGAAPQGGAVYSLDYTPRKILNLDNTEEYAALLKSAEDHAASLGREMGDEFKSVAAAAKRAGYDVIWDSGRREGVILTDAAVAVARPSVPGELIKNLGESQQAAMRNLFDEVSPGNGAYMLETLARIDRDTGFGRTFLARTLSHHYNYSLATNAMQKHAMEFVAVGGGAEAAFRYKMAKDFAQVVDRGHKKWTEALYFGLGLTRDKAGRHLSLGLGRASPFKVIPDSTIQKALSQLEDLKTGLGGAMDPAAARAVVDNPGVQKQLLAEAELVAMAGSGAGALAIAGNVGGVAKTVAVGNEFLLNSLLSGPVTHAVNFISNMAKMVLTPLEGMIGGALTFNSKVIGDSFRQGIGYFHSMRESLFLAARAGAQGHGLLSPQVLDGAMASQKFSLMGSGRGAIGAGKMWEGTWIGAAMNIVGETVRMPFRALATGDELFKQMAARSKLYSKYYAEATEKGLWTGGGAGAANDALWNSLSQAGGKNHTAMAAEWIANKVRGAFDPKTGRLLDGDALRFAEEATFQTPLGWDTIGGKMQALVTSHPWLRPIIPFVKTPVNLFRETVSRMPVLGQFSKQMSGWLASSNPEEVAKAYGRWAMGTAGAVTTLTMVMSGKITGSGPTDPSQNALLRQSGWQANSIVIDHPDGKKYLSYGRLDPLGSFLGFITDVGEVLTHGPDGADKDNLGAAALAAFANLTVNKTYLRGLTDFLEVFQSDNDRSINKYINTVTSGYIPNFLKWWQNDPLVREANDMVQAMKRKSFGSEDVPPQRNILGEPINAKTGSSWPLAWSSGDPDRDNILNRMSPFSYSKQLPDDVVGELAGLGKGFSKVSPTEDGLDLRTIRDSNGRYAYDRLQELTGEVKIGGKTLRERLTEHVGGDVYKALKVADPEKESAAESVSQIINAYRRAARQQMYKEFPKVWEHKLNTRREMARNYRAARLQQQTLGGFAESLNRGQ